MISGSTGHHNLEKAFIMIMMIYLFKTSLKNTNPILKKTSYWLSGSEINQNKTHDTFLLKQDRGCKIQMQILKKKISLWLTGSEINQNKTYDNFLLNVILWTRLKCGLLNFFSLTVLLPLPICLIIHNWPLRWDTWEGGRLFHSCPGSSQSLCCRLNKQQGHETRLVV